MRSTMPWRASLGRGGASSAIAALMVAAGSALATDGTDAMLVIDPTDAVSMRVGHYYQNARGIPDDQVIYMPIATSPYASLREFQLPAVRAMLDQRDLDQTVDFIVLAPSETFFNSAPNLFTDACSPVSRFSITSAYASLFLDDVFIAGGVPSLFNNPYGGPFSTNIVPFEGFSKYNNGFLNSNGNRVLISGLLGYTGERGNTVDEIITMIDRSVAADGTHPVGTVYFMQTTDAARSAPRHGAYPGTVAEIQALGDNAVHLMANLPIGQHDALGIMTGFANTNIDMADFTFLPGAFADHLTSFGAMFDNSQQTKASEWIRKGASGTFGTVQEPCNYPEKFPHARMHLFYHQGLPLGAAAFRSLRAFPVQGLLLGDPMTTPFDTKPIAAVTVTPGAGVATVGLSASTTKPNTPDPIFGRVFIDGVLSGVVFNNSSTPINTASLADGYHQVIVTVQDSSPVKSTASGSQGLMVSNMGRSVEFAAIPATGTIDQDVVMDARVRGADGASELRLLQNGRIVATAPGSQARLAIPGGLLGEGMSRVQLEAVFADGMLVRSAPQAITIAPGTPNAAPGAPKAYTVSVQLTPDADALVALPFSTDGDLSQLTFTILQPPAQATINVGPASASVLVTPNSGASGLDRLTYRVTGPGGSADGVIRISYDGDWPDDLTGDASVDTDDLYALEQALEDLNADGVADQLDVAFMEAIVRAELPIDR